MSVYNTIFDHWIYTGGLFEWQSSGNGSFIQGGMIYYSGYLTVPKNGLYYVYAQVHCTPNEYSSCGYNINVNMAKAQEHHFESYDGYYRYPVSSLTSESGLLTKLEMGDRLSVTARVSANYNPTATPTPVYFYMNFQSYFGAILLF